MKYYDTFISYHRASGASEAALLYYALRERGISVFMDVRQSESGDYEERITTIIKKCDNFILVLAGDTLSKCNSEADWPVKELKIAHEANLGIVPVFFSGAIRIVPDCISQIVDITLLQSVEYIHEHGDDAIGQLMSYLKNSVNRWQCVDILIKCLNSPCKTKGLSAFILGSSEMRLLENSEVHLLTNNLRDYDLTVIADVAISANIKRDIKYIYYSPTDCRSDFDELRTRIKWYLGKQSVALVEIDRWIRAYYVSESEISSWLNRINKVPLSTVIEDFFDGCCTECRTAVEAQLSNLVKSNLRTGQESIDVSSIIEWINGDRRITQSIAKSINALASSVSAIATCCQDTDAQRFQEWRKHCIFLGEMLFVSQGITACNINDAVIAFLEKIGVDEQLVEWFQADPVPETKIDSLVNNLFFCPLEADLTPIKQCYSFSLLLNPDGSTYAAGWYKATARRMHEDTQDVRENTLMIKGLESEQRGLLRDILKNIINRDEDFKNNLASTIFQMD